MADDLTFAGHAYRVGRLDVFAQLHVARKLAPVVSHLGPLFAAAADPSIARLAALEPIARALAEMPSDDVEFVLKTCMSVVSRDVGGGRGWAKVMTAGGPGVAPQLMYQDIDLPTMMQLAWAVVQENMSSFFTASPSASLRPEMAWTGNGQATPQ